MISCVTMTDVEGDLDKRFDDVDVESILARCGTNNRALTISRKRSLLRAPEFIKRLPAEETVEEGSSVTFGCKLVGLPKPTVTWYKDDDVIGPDARAKPESDNTGLHSLQIGEVSRCDVGTYKVRASNSEAKSKGRNRKKKSRAVACAPMFPAIVELDAEEQRERLEVERQPESPLTPLYTNISRKSPVTWPEYLGDWAYSPDANKHDAMDLEIECEDVFDSDSDVSPITVCSTLTFVSSAYAQTCNGTVGETPVDDSITSYIEPNDEKSPNDDVSGTMGDTCKEKECFRDFEKHDKEGDNNSASINDVLNNNEKNKRMSEQSASSNGKRTNENTNDVTRKSRVDMVRRSQGHQVPSKEVEDKTVICDPRTISKITVNRSYATGESTLSVARRSPSPYPHARKPMTNAQSERTRYSNVNDTSILQNLSNERILQRMKQSGKSFLSWNYFVLSYYRKCDEDHAMELFLLLCGGTFLALYLDLSPSTFILDILIALFIRMVLKFVLDET